MERFPRPPLSTNIALGVKCDGKLAYIVLHLPNVGRAAETSARNQPHFLSVVRVVCDVL